ncbi:MAG: hypothetical protein H6R45_1096 [Proteobacteria bacterium]|nr:hypothetical protein [Pseudomonadota bacterium]
MSLRPRCRAFVGTAIALAFTAHSVAAGAQGQPAAAPPPREWKYFPKPPRAPAGAPNVLLIMTDDVGFGSASTFGGLIPTPTFDALAKNGLRYNEFHTTAMCSPTRAALLTGRNAHAVASGAITNVAIDERGYTSIIPQSAATIGRVLHDNGYDTAFFGKNHNTPLWEAGPTGPFDHWPNGWGFDYFYGFNGAADDQFRPQLIENRNQVEPSDDPDYIFDEDMADHVLSWLRVQRVTHADKPFLAYLAPGSMHSPHQAPAEWVAKFKGKFDMGWDELRKQTFERQKAMGVIPADAKMSPRPSVLQPWDSVSPEMKRVYAHQMEIAAAQLAFFDFQVGRVIDDLRESGQLDNTMVIYLQGDNGASMDSQRGAVWELQSLMGIEPSDADLIRDSAQDGTPHSYSNYNPAWAWAQNAPFPWGKQIASHLGGLRDGLVISWPRRIKDSGGLRSQFHHVIDVAPTIYEAAGITPPEEVDGVKQQPIDGVSMVYSFDHRDAPSARREQYFEMLGNRSYYKDGWLASTTPGRAPFDRSTTPLDPMTFEWELYNLDADYSQTVNLAKKYPEKGGVAPGWDMIATFTTSAADAQGPVVFSGDEAGGAGLWLEDGRPIYLYNPTAREQDRVRFVGAPLSSGVHTVTISAIAQPTVGPRAARLVMTVDGKEAGRADLRVFYGARGTGYVGRYGTRTLFAGLANPPARALEVGMVRFEKR